MTIQRAIDSSPTPAQQERPDPGLRRLGLVTGDTDEDWRRFVDARREAELDELIESEEPQAPTRPGPSSQTPSATAPSRRPAPRSPRSCRRSRGSRPAATTARRSSACSTSSPSSSTGTSASSKSPVRDAARELRQSENRSDARHRYPKSAAHMVSQARGRAGGWHCPVRGVDDRLEPVRTPVRMCGMMGRWREG